MKYPPYPAYKHSNTEWIGKVPKDWAVKRLKYCTSINDEALPETTDPNFEFNYVDISSVSATDGIVAQEKLSFENAPSRARRIVRDGDTIISTVRTYLRAISPIRNLQGDIIVSTGFAVVRPRTVHSGFLSYALRESTFVESIVARSVGVSYPAVNAPDVATIPILLPPTPEQRTIADFLDVQTKKINTLIAKKRAFIEKLKEKRTALISHTVTRGLPPAAAKAAGLNHKPKLKPSGIEWLGDVPVHWAVRPLKIIVSEPITDGPHETPEILDDGIPFVSAESVRNNRIDFTRKRGFISREDHRKYSLKYSPKRDDIYMIKSGATTGNLAIVDTDDEFNIWSPLAAIRTNKKIASPRYVLHAMNAKEFQTSVQLFWSYGTQQNIGMNVIENLVIPLPPLIEQDAIANYLDRETSKIDRMIKKVEAVIEKLQEYRTALITAAVTGKIDVRKVAAKK
jgi:type I restriction enzyme S subunit